MSMVRPLLTYACPVWFNTDPSVMEEIRIFESKCIRCCLGMGSRSASSDYKKYHSNQVIFNAVDVSRIDNHIIHLARKFNSRLQSILNPIVANYISGISEEYMKNCMQSGFIPPEAFIYLDSLGYIQNQNGIPVFYHIIRKHPKSSIQYELSRKADLSFET